MLDGHMRHEDNGGNTGDLGPGDVQWMTAARGIIHSEMPQQTEGRMRGFQLWLNLPAKEKMKPAAYSDIPSAAIPVASLGKGVTAKVIAGNARARRQENRGADAGREHRPALLRRASRAARRVRSSGSRGPQRVPVRL